GAFPIRTLSLNLGDRRPLGVGSGSLALLAFLSEADRHEVLDGLSRQLTRYPRFTTTGIRRLMDETRARGYSFVGGTILPGCRRPACRSWTATGTPSPGLAWPPSTPGWPSRGVPRWSAWFSQRPLRSLIASALAAVRRFLLPPGPASSASALDTCRCENSTSHQTPSPTRRCRARGAAPAASRRR